MLYFSTRPIFFNPSKFKMEILLPVISIRLSSLNSESRRMTDSFAVPTILARSVLERLIWLLPPFLLKTSCKVNNVSASLSRTGFCARESNAAYPGTIFIIMFIAAADAMDKGNAFRLVTFRGKNPVAFFIL